MVSLHSIRVSYADHNLEPLPFRFGVQFFADGPQRMFASQSEWFDERSSKADAALLWSKRDGVLVLVSFCF
jgi:hypothetical protein